jgi:protein SCO1/2
MRDLTRVSLGRWFRLHHLKGFSLSLVLIATACGEPTFKGVAIEPPREIPAFTFVQSTGDTVRFAPEAGRPTLVFFGYTHCPDVCPVTLADWSRAKAALGEKASRVRWIFVTVDPARDTPAVAEAYARRFDASFIGVSGDSATTSAIQEAFTIASYETPGATDADYLVTHASQSFLIDDAGQLRAMYSFNSGVEAIVADLAQLLR